MKNLNNKDYQDFINSEGASPPNELSQKILTDIKKDLNPGHPLIFLKFFGIHLFVGFLTLTFCPQFDLSLTNNYELFHYFHHTYGANICMALCGSIFLGSGALLASIFLGPSEIKGIKNSSFAYYLILTMIILALFLSVGSSNSLSLTVFWIAGALFSGFSIFESGKFIRFNLLRNTQL